MVERDTVRSDRAAVGAAELLDMVAPALRPEERREFFDEAYLICRRMLEKYDQQIQRESARLWMPSRN